VTQRDSTLATGLVLVTTYAYDALNRLRSVRQGATLIARYAYDVQSRRIAKRVYSILTGGTLGYTRFVYHGDHIAFETDSAGTVQRSYTWGLGTDDLVAVREGSNNFYATQDKLGSVRALSKRDGTHAVTLTYAPWGRAIDSVVALGVVLRYRWTGREHDPETGWYFHRTRYYSPALRRFVQEDPIGFSGGANVYAYVDGQVLEATDPDGLANVWKGGGPNSRFYDPGGNDMGFQFLERRFDPFPQGSYLAERSAQRDAAYEMWVLAGSESRDGQRVLATESAAEFVDRVLDSEAQRVLSAPGANGALPEFYVFEIHHENFRTARNVDIDREAPMNRVIAGTYVTYEPRLIIHLEPDDSGLPGAWRPGDKVPESIRYNGYAYVGGYSGKKVPISGNVTTRIGHGRFFGWTW
jgi:RHS repeat-associated protein